MTPSTVYVCESQPILLEGLRCVLDGSGEFELVGVSKPASTAAEEIAGLAPAIVLVELAAGWRELQQLLEDLRHQSPGSKTVVWGEGLTSSDCYRALQVGAHGVFRRSLPVQRLLECFREVAAGRIWMEPGEEAARTAPRKPNGGLRLTPRERDVVRLVSLGLKNREIADDLSITTGTVKVHLMHVFEKTGVKDRYELAVQARSLLSERPVSP